MEFAIIAGGIFFLAGLVKGIVGFGFPLIALVLLTLSIGLLDALALIVFPTFVTNLWQAFSDTYLRDIVRRMWRYFCVAAIFVLLTSQYLSVANVHWLTALLGVVLMVFVISQWLDVHLSIAPERERLLSLALGAVNGVITGLTGMFMVPSVMYMQALGFPRDMLVQAMGVFFGLSMLMLAISLGMNRLISADQAAASVAALAPSFAGLYVGRWIRTRIDEKQFQAVFLASLLVIGCYLIYRSVVMIGGPAFRG